MNPGIARLIRKRRVELRKGEDATLQVGRWARYLSASEAGEDTQFGAALAEHADLKSWPGFVRDLFGDLYALGGEKVDEPAPEYGWVSKVLEAAARLPEWNKLRRSAEGDAWRCALSASAAIEALEPVIESALEEQRQAERKQQEAEEAERAARQAAAAAAAAKGRAARAAAAEAAEAAQQAAEAAATAAAEAFAAVAEKIDGHEVRAAMRAASNEATEEIEEMERAMSGLGVGTGPGSLSTVAAPTDVIQAALRKNPKLKRIALVAGRMRISAARVQRGKSTVGRDEYHDVELGDDIARLLPSELQLLAEPGTELLIYRKLTEQGAAQFAMRGRERVEHGPIVVCVDGSGSMAGQRNEWAMGVALALLEIAARQRRPFELVHFDGRVQAVWSVPNPRHVSFEDLIKGISYFSGGGTDFRAPLKHAGNTIRTVSAFKKADVVMITDGESYGYEGELDALHKAGVRTYAIGIGEASERALSAFGSVACLKAIGSEDAKLDLVFGLGTAAA